MAGTVWKILVQPGDRVEGGQDVVILESMKMEVPVACDQAGVVKEVKVAEGDFVDADEILVVVE